MTCRFVVTAELYAARRLVVWHTVQYGFDSSFKDPIDHTQLQPSRRLDRYYRCYRCEQWSPCDVLVLAHAELARHGLDPEAVLREQLERLDDDEE